MPAELATTFRMIERDDSQASDRTFDPVTMVAKHLAFPTLIAAYLFQQDIILLSFKERMIILCLGLLPLLLGSIAYHKFYHILGVPGILLGLTVAPLIMFTAYFVKPEAKSKAANARRCLAIQQDMLSYEPLRDDGADLFQALGCRPRGEGSVYAPASTSMIVVHDWLPWGGLPPTR